MSFVPQSSTIRDALQGQLLDQFDPSQFESQGGMLYLSLNSAINQMDLISMVQTWQASHLPSFGQMIPQSGIVKKFSVDDTATAFVTPTNNEVYVCEGISCTGPGLGGDDMSINVTLESGSDVITLVEAAAVGAAATAAIPLSYPIKFDRTMVLKIVDTAAAGGTASAALYKVAQ